MILATSNKTKNLICLSYIDHVTIDDLRRGHDEVVALVSELPPGFTLLVDLDRLGSMDTGCVEELGKIMELLDQRGLRQVVRVIPDPTKDIGFNILARFHYHRDLRTLNCETMTQAAKLLHF